MKTTSHALLALFLLTGLSAWAQETALDRYIAKPDPNYTYTIIDLDDHFLHTNYFINLTSQQWRSQNEVDRVLWQHDMVVVIPQNPFSEVFGLFGAADAFAERTAILLIDGGSNDGGGPGDDLVKIMELLSAATNSITAVIRQVPNQPLNFADEINNPRTDDAILAYSFDKYLTTGDEEWPVHLAMTKAAIRAMDTVQDVAAREGEHVDNFVVIGGSKRGWTAWLVAAADPTRIKGIIPVSTDLLNMEPQFIHHWEAYGFYAPALSDYVEFDLPCQVNSPAGRELRKIVDPYEYRDRYTMPKLIINSAGDQFFLPDSSQFYYHDLPDPKQLRYTLNTDHGQGDNFQDLVVNIALWVDDVINDRTGPLFSWSLEPDGSLRVHTATRPDKVYLWQASNPNARDFRLESIGQAWSQTELGDGGGGVYYAQVPTPAQGFTAFTVELVFEEDVALGLLQADLRVSPHQ
jgi:PhoPQ-activated pathogenicity-related protein